MWWYSCFSIVNVRYNWTSLSLEVLTSSNNLSGLLFHNLLLLYSLETSTPTDLRSLHVDQFRLEVISFCSKRCFFVEGGSLTIFVENTVRDCTCWGKWPQWVLQAFNSWMFIKKLLFTFHLGFFPLEHCKLNVLAWRH